MAGALGRQDHDASGGRANEDERMRIAENATNTVGEIRIVQITTE